MVKNADDTRSLIARFQDIMELGRERCETLTAEITGTIDEAKSLESRILELIHRKNDLYMSAFNKMAERDSLSSELSITGLDPIDFGFEVVVDEGINIIEPESNAGSNDDVEEPATEKAEPVSKGKGRAKKNTRKAGTAKPMADDHDVTNDADASEANTDGDVREPDDVIPKTNDDAPVITEMNDDAPTIDGVEQDTAVDDGAEQVETDEAQQEPGAGTTHESVDDATGSEGDVIGTDDDTIEHSDVDDDWDELELEGPAVTIEPEHGEEANGADKVDKTERVDSNNKDGGFDDWDDDDDGVIVGSSDYDEEDIDPLDFM